MEEIDDVSIKQELSPLRKQNLKLHSYLGSKVNRQIAPKFIHSSSQLQNKKQMVYYSSNEILIREETP